MYAKCGSVEYAGLVFERMDSQNVVSWNSMIAGYAQNEPAREAIEIFCRMIEAGIKPNQATFASVLRAVANPVVLEQGREVHAHIIKAGLGLDVIVGSALLDVYSKCASMMDARKLFDSMPEQNVVSWTAMIAGYTQNGQAEEALKLLSQMQKTCSKMNRFTLSSVLSAGRSLAALQQGKQGCANIIKTEVKWDACVGNSHVTMYASHKRFRKVIRGNEVSSTATMSGVKNVHDEEAFKLLNPLHDDDVKPNQFTFACALTACVCLASLGQGKQVHAQVIKSGFESHITVGNSLIDMYAKSGSLVDACNVFDKRSEQNVITWTAMIAGCAQHGQGKEALSLVLFEKMQDAGVKPNHITYVCVLSACSHAGLVDEGRHYFAAMSREHGITARIEHFACMVDLLGRTGHRDEAEQLINEMPFEPSALLWQTLLGACRIYCNVEIGKRTAERIIELEPEEVSTYVLLSNIYTEAGKWNDVMTVRKLMRDRCEKVARTQLDSGQEQGSYIFSGRQITFTNKGDLCKAVGVV